MQWGGDPSSLNVLLGSLQDDPFLRAHHSR